MNTPKPMLASEYAEAHNTSTDVIIALIKDKRIPALVAGKDKRWYVPLNTPFTVSPNECRLIHITNRLKQVFEANRIKLHTPKTKGLSTIFDERTTVDADECICLNPVKREAYIAKRPLANDMDITGILISEGIPTTKENVRKRVELIINQRLYNSYIVIVPGIRKYAVKGTFNEAIEIASILSKKNRRNVKIYYKARKVRTCEYARKAGQTDGT